MSLFRVKIKHLRLVGCRLYAVARYVSRIEGVLRREDEVTCRMVLVTGEAR